MIVPAEQIERLYDEVLKPRIDALEGLRRDLKRYLVKAGLLVGVPFALFLLQEPLSLIVGDTAATVLGGAGFVLIFVGVVASAFLYLLPGVTAFMNYQQRFKREVVSEVFRIVCPTARYDPNHGLPDAIVNESGLFAVRGGLVSDDRVRGTIGRTPFEAAEVKRSYKTGGKNNSTVIVFHGLFFHIDFNKAVRGVTLVQPESPRGVVMGDRDGLSSVALESTDFAREFTVYSSDETEARYILTPAMMERLLSLRRLAGQQIFAAFKGNRAYLGIHYGRQLFEPGIRTTTSKEAIVAMAGEFALAEAIVNELDLNTRIWTKDVDPSLLQRTDDVPMETFDRLADEAAAGSLTAEQLFNAAIEDDEQADETPVAQPASTSIRIDRMPGSTTVTYGGRVSFAIWILLWLACFPVAAAAFRAEVEDAASILHVEAFIALARLVPPMPSVDAWVASQPLAWLIGACILGGCAALAWPLRVRRVRIEPAAVSVHRGLRPWPRRYARPPYNGIVNLRQALYLKSDGFSLYTPTASPMLSEDEARWLASEMRRAMKETAMRVTMFLLAASVIVPGIASAQAGAAPRNDLPQPYRTERSWGELPPGVTWAAVTAIEPAPDGTIYVVHRCFENSCAGRPEAPVLKYNADGKLLGSFGQGVFVFPHGGTVDAEGNLWMTDAGSAPGKGHQVFKFSPDGRILMTLGKAGVSGSGRDLFDQPTDIVVAPGGDLFVTDSHRNGTNNRVVHFTKEGRFVKEWGRKGSGRGEISEPHTIAMDSRGRLFVGDRENNRIQIFDQSGSFLEEWRQFGRPSGIAITGDDRIYVADSESWGTDTGAHELPGIKKGIRIGSARTGIVDAFIEDQESTAADHAGAEGVGVDMQGNVYGGVVRRRMLERHIRR